MSAAEKFPLPAALERPDLVRLGVVIPALNEEATIADVVASVPRDIPGVSAVDVIVVDDGSTDGTRVRSLAAGADAIARHPRRQGLAASFRDGVREALRRGATIVVNLDADGQHDPAMIPRLVEPILAGEADLVLGVRPLAQDRQMSSARRYGNLAGSWMVRRTLGMTITDATTGFRAFSREALLRLNITSDYTYTLETLIEAARKRLAVAEVRVPVRPRLVGESRMTRSVTRYVSTAGGQAARGLIRNGLVRLLGRAAFAATLLALLLTCKFLWGYRIDGAGRHLPALLAAILFATTGAALFVARLIADGIETTRRLLEDALYSIRRLEVDGFAARRDA
ncbi:MAG TPA: glycosyltransferase family 2 protein [Gaiellaceae bacterium]|jgi:glycosyltransferase involved in cell wall biosynthesis|nr:glycosyltransferase family 2 protein [Gaiellaceae bacterium]